MRRLVLALAAAAGLAVPAATSAGGGLTVFAAASLALYSAFATARPYCIGSA